ncbi:MAG: radical SAM family heme chaperone HemW [Lachnospiraceae bacterium]|nr:radical SAM family heme chaperone HemW [Lachnospiraceae bacterium]
MTRELEIYIHIPFCVRKCAYCDFLSGPADQKTQEQYTDALIREIQAFPDAEQYVVCSVFIGGGTPSVLSKEAIGRILETVRRKFHFVSETNGDFGSVEITIECNPGTAGEEKLSYYRKIGINRLSLGLQSADNRELVLLGRIHTWEAFLETYHAARHVGFTNINIDLMSGLPGQSVVSWERTLDQVLALEPEHISAYSLIIEEGTPFYTRYRKDEKLRDQGEEPELLPSEEAERQMYARTEEKLLEHGMYRYEISNYAKPGFACRHNDGYWTGVWYAGFGLGASSLLNHTRYRNTEHMEEYLTAAPEQLAGYREAEPLTQNDEMEEFMFLGLRRMAGVSESEFKKRFRRTIREVYGEIPDSLIRHGLLARKGDCYFLTPEGMNLSNYVMSEFILTSSEQQQKHRTD